MKHLQMSSKDFAGFVIQCKVLRMSLLRSLLGLYFLRNQILKNLQVSIVHCLIWTSTKLIWIFLPVMLAASMRRTSQLWKLPLLRILLGNSLSQTLLNEVPSHTDISFPNFLSFLQLSLLKVAMLEVLCSQSSLAK